MAKKKIDSLWVWIVLGTAILLSGLASFNSNLEGYIIPLLLGFSGVVLLSQVSIKGLFNRDFDTSDITDMIELVAGNVVLASAIVSVPFVGVSLPAFLSGVVSMAVIITGALIILQGARMR